LLIEERFNNFECSKNVECPTVILHGIQDFIVPFEHSIEMLILGFKKCKAHMFLQENMEHNKFNYSNDIVRPLAYFFKVNNIGVKPLSDSQKSKEKLEKI
jgi:dipeptidyl aminopeptidase/acylaminoacyl peptidase